MPPQSARPGVFLDRDGVLIAAVVRNGVPHPPDDIHGLQLLPGALEACQTLRAEGFVVVVVTNQPDVARGTQSRAAVEGINRKLRQSVPLDDIRVCWHDDSDGCACRKPKPGLLIDAAKDWNIDLERSFMVGDRWKDIDAGRRAGCRTVFLDCGYDEPRPVDPTYTAPLLADAVSWILQSVAAVPAGDRA